MKFSHDVRGPSCFPAPLSNVTFHSKDIRQSPLSLEVVENRTNAVFWLPVFGRDAPDYSTRLLARFTVHHLAKFG